MAYKLEIPESDIRNALFLRFKSRTIDVQKSPTYLSYETLAKLLKIPKKAKLLYQCEKMLKVMGEQTEDGIIKDILVDNYDDPKKKL